MRFNYKTVVLSLLMVMCAASLWAQSQNNSPYSRFGIGDINDSEFVFLRSMGGISSAYADPAHMNIVNPASYAFLKTTSFEIGINANYSRLSDGVNPSSSTWGGGLEYISLGFPLRNAITQVFDRIKTPFSNGMNFTLIRNSQVNYDVSSFENIDNVGQIERNYSGSGGTYKFIWGNALKYKDLSFGLNIGYLFGKLSYENNVLFRDIPNSRQDNFINDYSISSFIWNVGLIYDLHLNRAEVEKNKQKPLKRITFGIHANPKYSFKTNGSDIKRTLYNPTTFLEFQDTLTVVEGTEGNGKLPSEIGIGIVYYYGDKLSLGFNFKSSHWSSYENEANPEELSNSYKVSFGGFYRPNSISFSFLERMQYRFGVFYSQDPRSINTEKLNNFGVNLGIGLPLVFQRRLFSNISIGMDLGRRGTGTVIEETYWKINLGVNFNDNEWFIKRKLE